LVIGIPSILCDILYIISYNILYHLHRLMSRHKESNSICEHKRCIYEH
jgi:hypothetical protein